MSVTQLFEDIADAIRDKNPNVNLLTPTEMPQAIRDIPSGQSHSYRITVKGGYNGGATITVYYDGYIKFQATGNSPYNLAYSPASGSFTDAGGRTVSITITPPVNNTSPLVISLSGGISGTTGDIMPQGANTSYGYDYDSTTIPV